VSVGPSILDSMAYHNTKSLSILTQPQWACHWKFSPQNIFWQDEYTHFLFLQNSKKSSWRDVSTGLLIQMTYHNVKSLFWSLSILTLQQWSHHKKFKPQNTFWQDGYTHFLLIFYKISKGPYGRMQVMDQGFLSKFGNKTTNMTPSTT